MMLVLKWELLLLKLLNTAGNPAAVFPMKRLLIYPDSITLGYGGTEPSGLTQYSVQAAHLKMVTTTLNET